MSVYLKSLTILLLISVPLSAAAQSPRLVVAGSDAEGRSYVVSDTRVPAQGGGSLFATNAQFPLGKNVVDDGRVRPMERTKLDVDPGGTSLLFFRLPPSTGNATPQFSRTETLDYVMVTGGDLVLILDKGEVTLLAGDIVIQRNTRHAWRNASSTQPAVAWVLIVGLKAP